MFLRNAGPLAQPELQVAEHAEFDRDMEELMDSDRSGRRFDGGAAATSGGARSAMEMPDLEAKHLEDVAERILAALTDKHQKSPVGGLLIVAPPTFLGVMRQKMSDELRGLVVGEVAKDLAEMPVPDIQKSLLKVL